MIAGDMMRQTLFLRGTYASDVVAGSTDMLRKMQYQRNIYASDAVVSGAIVKRSRHPQEAITQNLRPFSASLR